MSPFAEGDRVRTAQTHPWKPNRNGVVKALDEERYIVKFDKDECGLWHDEDGDPVLKLGEKDLVPSSALRVPSLTRNPEPETRNR